MHEVTHYLSTAWITILYIRIVLQQQQQQQQQLATRRSEAGGRGLSSFRNCLVDWISNRGGALSFLDCRQAEPASQPCLLAELLYQQVKLPSIIIVSTLL